MKEDELIQASLNLRRKLYKVNEEFWKNNKKISQDKIFYINSVVMSSLIAQIVYTMFKKDIGLSKQFEYIDKICELAKKQLEDGSYYMTIGVQ